MKPKKPNAELVCKQFEDALAPRLRLSTADRVGYYHLLRHSRLEGKSRLHFSTIWLARNLGLSVETVRRALRRLLQHRALRLIERSKAGHVMDVRLPEEVPGARRSRAQTPAALPPDGGNLEEIDFMRTPELRQAIHAREGAAASTASAASARKSSASTTSYPAPNSAPTLTATWSPAAWSATPARASAPPRLLALPLP